jgi:peptidyl-prolyl cis-trans isomerase B (cyclophilin B)
LRFLFVILTGLYLSTGVTAVESASPLSTETYNTDGSMSSVKDQLFAQARDAAPKKASKYAPPTLADVGDTSEVAIISTPKGEIVLEFWPKLAPLHVGNFKKLAKVGFYDGTTFHRVVPGFVIQGGDPNSKDTDRSNDGMGGPGYGVKAEFNPTLHEKGILSMARSSDPNSAGSQFFIVLARAPHLDNQYTVFGRVIKGLDVVDAIGAQKRDPSNPKDRESPAVVMKSVKIVKRSAVTGLDAAKKDAPKSEKK